LRRVDPPKFMINAVLRGLLRVYAESARRTGGSGHSTWPSKFSGMMLAGTSAGPSPAAIDAQTLREAHRQVESARTIGKVVIAA